MLAVRIASIEIHNLKNVGYGRVDLLNDKYSSSVLGLYGQNGSGKTTLIKAISILKTLMCGRSLKPAIAALIKQDKPSAKLTFEFLLSELYTYKKRYSVTYSFEIVPEETLNPDDGKKIIRTNVINEILKYKEFKASSDYDSDISRRFRLILNTGRKEIATKEIIKLLRRETSQDKYDLDAIRVLSQAEGRSFAFNFRIGQILLNNAEDPEKQLIMESLLFFAHRSLYSIENEEFNLISTDILMVHLKKGIDEKQSYSAIPILLNSEVEVPEIFVNDFESILESLNVVLGAIIPGMSIITERISKTTDKEGLPFCRLAVYSQRGNAKVALQHESEGIKKIISILQLLIYAYNSKNITIAIDELDAGIFEYLLGEILSIFSSTGKGQLIFTSHNLRPLETMDKLFIAFTTINENKRYVRPTRIKKNNNLRSTYYRDIEVSYGQDAFYEAADSAKIQIALSKAGRMNRSENETRKA